MNTNVELRYIDRYIVMNGSSEERINALIQAINREDHNEVYEFSKQLMKDYPEDQSYAHCFILASLRIGVGGELTQHHFKHPPNPQTHAHLQELYAYYLYDQGLFQKVVYYVESVKPSPTLSLLQAQAYFRNQQYPQATKKIQQLLQQSQLSPEDRQEYLIDLLACGLNQHFTPAQLSELKKEVVVAERKELLYNYSLVLWAAGEHSASQHWLAEYQRGLKQGSDNDDIAMVRLFRDYTQWQHNNPIEKGVVPFYEGLLSTIENRNLKGVVQNNLIYLRMILGMEQSHDQLRIIEQTLGDDYRMTGIQRMGILLNKLSLLLRKGRTVEANRLVRELEGIGEVSRLSQFIKSKYYMLRRNHEEKLQVEYAEWVAGFDPEMGFCLRADALREAGKEESLIGELRKGGEKTQSAIRHYIFGLLVRNKSLFEEYSDFLGQLGEASKDLSVLQMLISIYQAKGDFGRQRSLLQKCYSLYPKNISIRAKLANLQLKQGQLDQAEETMRGIDLPQDLPDAAHLQFIEKNIHLSVQKEQSLDEQQIKKDDTHRKRIRKKKKVRLPKNIDKIMENFKGDPERWLPKWQRKGYKKKGKKGAGKTQGLATVGREEKNTYAAGTSTSNKEVTKATRKKNK